MHYYTSHLVDRQGIIYISIILNCGNVDIYLASDNALLYPTLAVLKSDDVGIVVVAQEVAVHLSVVLRRAEDVVYLTSLVALAAYYLLYPTT